MSKFCAEPECIHPLPLRIMHWLTAPEVLDAPLTASFGAPIRLRTPTKLGFKTTESIVAMEVTNQWTGGYRENQGYNWFSG